MPGPASSGYHFPAGLYGNPDPLPQQLPPTTIRLPAMAQGPRRSSRRLNTGSEGTGASGSEYHDSDKSMEAPNGFEGAEEAPEPPVEYGTSQRGRRVVKKTYVESNSEDDGFLAQNLFDDDHQSPVKLASRRSHDVDDDEDADDVGPRRYQTRRNTRRSSFISDDENEENNSSSRYPTRSRRKTQTRSSTATSASTARPKPSGPSKRSQRLTRRNATRASQEEEDVYVDHPSSGASADADGSIDDAPQTSSDIEPEPEPEPEQEDEGDGKPYALRQRQRINYAIPPPLEDLRKPPPKSSGGGRNGGRSNGGYHGGHGRGIKGKGLGWSASGAELGRWMGMGGDDSDSDHPTTRTPRKGFGGGFGGAMAGAAGGAGMLGGDLAAGGTPSNLGKIGHEAGKYPVDRRPRRSEVTLDIALADADPLGVNVNVTFDEVGGLDEHIHSLKEMTLLPLLYPEVFQKFNVTPPRGVLFHGPPGTGKTLLARALATSCRSDGRSISFFMRKGADCLSKWVGEAERQLRLLFEEARASQPSIIFFDEIDGLAPPETIGVGLRDFMISIKKLVPSSARSTSSSASPLPTQFGPLLIDALERVKTAIGRVLPMEKKLTALEEAMFEDDDGEDGALEREMLMQSMQTLRIYRPRVVVHGPVGMGQNYVGAAALHHLEGYHIQTLELGTLMSDSTRTVEAGIVQLFVEAKRHQPSVIYIPSVLGWCAAVSETSRSTLRAMLDTLAPTDPILLLVVVDGDYSDLPHDVKAWFGPSKDNRIALFPPSPNHRAEFFAPLIKDVQRPPNQFADGVKRKPRVLEKLPIAPPLEPRKLTAVELAAQEENDQWVITLLKYRLGPILTELKRKFKRFTKRATEEYNFEEEILVPVEAAAAPVAPGPPDPPLVNGVIDMTQTAEQEVLAEQTVPEGLVNGVVHHHEELPAEQQQQIAVVQLPPLFDIDLEKMHSDLFKGRYLTPQDFLDDVGKMVHNANARSHEGYDRLLKAQAMFTTAQVSIQEFDPQFRLECERMAVRERKRREDYQKAREKGKDKGKSPEELSNGPVNGMRRSGRNNGQQPELGITDPVQLERRLKRQRSNEATSDSHVSEEETGLSRDAKRSRINDDDDDPLNIVGRAPQPRVHFATEIETGSQPVPVVPPPNDTDMVVDDAPTAPRSGGFDPSLLNPMPSPNIDINPFFNGASTSSHAGEKPPSPAAFEPSNNFLASAPLPAPVSAPSPPHTPSAQRSRTTTKSPEAPNQNQNIPASPPSMVIERIPTPLPDFHIDDTLVDELQRRFCDDTDELTIEELEHLRATCLGCVWRHRTEWDRDALLKELLNVVKEFVAEVHSQ
ncbi:hypothetical protein DXG03_003573 [Asterophora parasitica]|uniref:AAA+ ATPase domain-containing protein n=1 Tax=Asterophora parasitica TaxID=117018 RepID=A0A9P7G1Z6_9AGAR|nr:hypothetical protein DXG03_003573 [Asterophora parasitica]